MTMWRLSALALAAAAAGDDTFFLKPNKTGVDLALVIIQGASCPPGGYRPVAEAIQRASSFAVWVGVPEYIDDTPEPVQFGAKLEAVLKQMRDAGMHANRTVLLAHSLGGVMAQNWLAPQSAPKADGLVLYGATLLRSHRGKPFPVPTLTVDGDLDGLLRVTRQVEAFHHLSLIHI